MSRKGVPFLGVPGNSLNQTSDNKRSLVPDAQCMAGRFTYKTGSFWGAQM